MDGLWEGEAERLIGMATGISSPILYSEPIGGGSIGIGTKVELRDGRVYFVKRPGQGSAQTLRAEAVGLRALAHAGAIRVPKAVVLSDNEDYPLLVVEWVGRAPRRPDYMAALGKGLALLHRATTHDKHGFTEDNFIGATPQRNTWCADGAEFFREHRLRFQIDLAARNGHLNKEHLRIAQRFLTHVDQILAPLQEEKPCLLHGDLWSGNALSDETGAPVIIDPAVYYGWREADLAMTQLFGGFDEKFYRSYDETWPLLRGHEERQPVFALYHQLNHLNLFGVGYRSGCLEIMRRWA